MKTDGLIWGVTWVWWLREYWMELKIKDSGLLPRAECITVCRVEDRVGLTGDADGWGESWRRAVWRLKRGCSGNGGGRRSWQRWTGSDVFSACRGNGQMKELNQLATASVPIPGRSLWPSDLMFLQCVFVPGQWTNKRQDLAMWWLFILMRETHVQRQRSSGAREVVTSVGEKPGRQESVQRGKNSQIGKKPREHIQKEES